MNKIIKFETNNCAPCKMVGMVLDQKNVEYEIVQVEESLDYAESMSVHQVPVVMVLNESGEELERVEGFNPPLLETLIDKYSEEL